MKLGTQPVKHAMSVDIIVTYTQKRHVYAKLENAEKLLSKSQQQVGLHQAHFEIATQITSAMTYDDVMANVRDAVFAVSEQTLGIDRHEIIKISTCGDWAVWERVTGRSSAEGDANSAICRNGKFWF